MLFVAAALLIAGVVVFTLGVRPKDLPEPAPVSPFKHLDERRAQIYENLRDLQFEFRVGKLSEEDYQKTKVELQRELANVMSEIDQLKSQVVAAVAAAPAVSPAAKSKQAPQSQVCPHCGAKFAQALKFCGECGKPMTGDAA